MNKIAIYDSNFVVALVDEDDKSHRTALELHSLIKTKNLLIVYFDCVANVAEEMGIKYIVSFDKDFHTMKELTRIYDKQSLESLVHDKPN